MSPRMWADGKVVLVNRGTPTHPDVHVVPTLEDINNGIDITPYLQEAKVSSTTPEEKQTMRDFAASLGVAAEALDAFVEQWDASAQAILEAPKQELLYRLNSQVRGIDPGQPVNWPGERGLY